MEYLTDATRSSTRRSCKCACAEAGGRSEDRGRLSGELSDTEVAWRLGATRTHGASCSKFEDIIGTLTGAGLVRSRPASATRLEAVVHALAY